MLRLDQLKLSPGESERLLRKKAAKLLRVPEGEILSLRGARRAVDARAPLQLDIALWPSRCGRRSRYCAAAAISA